MLQVGIRCFAVFPIGLNLKCAGLSNINSVLSQNKCRFKSRWRLTLSLGFERFEGRQVGLLAKSLLQEMWEVFGNQLVRKEKSS